MLLTALVSQHLTKNVPALEDKLKKLKAEVSKNVSDEAEVSRLEGALKKAKDGMSIHFFFFFFSNGTPLSY
jgi:hypothetical protein